jgi:hypothetical protein
VITSGELNADPLVRRRFGSNPLAGPTGGNPTRDADASGVALGLGYASREGGLAADLGTTPLGFRTTNLVGGVEVAPRLAENLRLRLTAERRAVTDSLLSWSGARDPLSGRTFGGVVRTGGKAQLEYAAGPANFYLGGGWSVLEGEGVVRNTRAELGAGVAYTVFRRPDEELTVGADLVHLAYDRNLRHFTLGHGGYFSPQAYTALNIPVDYRARTGDLSWRVGATVGYGNWREDGAPVFPGDPARQGALEGAAAGDTTLRPRYAGQSQGGFVGGLRADAEYALTPALRVGGLLRYDRAANWNEARGMLFARYRLQP